MSTRTRTRTPRPLAPPPAGPRRIPSTLRTVPVEALALHPENAREGDIGAICQSIEENGLYGRLLVQASTGYILKGNHTYQSLVALGAREVDVEEIDVSDEHARRILLADNRTSDLAEYNLLGLANSLRRQMEEAGSLSGTGYDGDDLDDVIARLNEAAREAERHNAEAEGAGGPDSPEAQAARATLAERFIVPPFSVLDARQGYWRERKQAWLDLGVQGAGGRSADLLFRSETVNDPAFYAKKTATEAALGRTLTTAEFLELHYDRDAAQMHPGISVFDPVLCEVVYRWFVPKGGHILDPFAGEATKGVVAAYLGHPYTGVELRPEQITENERVAATMPRSSTWADPAWHQGDAARLADYLPAGERYDAIFTSPPYYDLEVYSTSAKDGSAMVSYADYMRFYAAAFRAAVERLKDNRFLVVKVGEIRNKRTGVQRNFVGDNIRTFLDLGLHYYNEAVLVTAVGSLAIRAGRAMAATRKLGKGHQNVLVFWKGDPERLTRLYRRTHRRGRALEAQHENLLVFYKGDPRRLPPEYAPTIEAGDPGDLLLSEPPTVP